MKKSVIFVFIIVLIFGLGQGALPPPYLGVPNFKQCLGTYSLDSSTHWCIPPNRPENCPESSWADLTNGCRGTLKDCPSDQVNSVSAHFTWSSVLKVFVTFVYFFNV